MSQTRGWLRCFGLHARKGLGQHFLIDEGVLQQVVAAAELCRDIQLCHKMYQSAERIIHTRPERAKELLARVVRLAPEDTELYRAARNRLVKL